MHHEDTSSRVSMHVTRGCLVVPIQVELRDELIQATQADILEQVRRLGLKGVVIDASGVSIIDRFIGDRLADSANGVVVGRDNRSDGSQAGRCDVAD